MELQQYPTTEVHISTIKKGDTIIHVDGFVRTVCQNNIKEDKFMGRSLFGDSYKSGHRLVKKILI
jgi:hypothetical protein